MASATDTDRVPDELREQLDAGFPEAWIPKKAGDTISGTMLRLEDGPTSYGRQPLVVIAQSGDGAERSIWLFYESLRTGFARCQPQPGERIAVRYLGEEKVKNPTQGRKATYHNFKVVVDRPIESAEVNWASVSSDAPAPEQVIEEDDIPL